MSRIAGNLLKNYNIALRPMAKWVELQEMNSNHSHGWGEEEERAKCCVSTSYERFRESVCLCVSLWLRLSVCLSVCAWWAGYRPEKVRLILYRLDTPIRGEKRMVSNAERSGVCVLLWQLFKAFVVGQLNVWVRSSWLSLALLCVCMCVCLHFCVCVCVCGSWL
jgi:hypothetical protein